MLKTNFCWKYCIFLSKSTENFWWELMKISIVKMYRKFILKNNAHFLKILNILCWKVQIYIENGVYFLLKRTAHFYWKIPQFCVEKCGRFLLGSIETLLLKVSCNDKTTVQATSFLTKSVYVKKSKTYLYRDMWCINKVCLFDEKIH